MRAREEQIIGRVFIFPLVLVASLLLSMLRRASILVLSMPGRVSILVAAMMGGLPVLVLVLSGLGGFSLLLVLSRLVCSSLVLFMSGRACFVTGTGLGSFSRSSMGIAGTRVIMPALKGNVLLVVFIL